MRGPSREFRVIFHEEFRRQIRRRGFAFFTLLIPILMGIAILVTPFIVNLIESDSPDDPGAGDAAPLESAGYTDPTGILPGPGLQAAPRQYSDLSEGIQVLQQGTGYPARVMAVWPDVSGAARSNGLSKTF